MTRDIVCDENELSVAVNNILEYGDFLSRTIANYIEVLSELQEKGIKDDLVCSKLSSIARSLQPYQNSIPEECGMLAYDVVSGFIAGVEQADKFVFPKDITMTIASILASFI